jgi:hypothetical protein
MGRHPRHLGDQGEIGIDQLEALAVRARPHLLQQQAAADAAKPRVAVGEPFADVALPQRAQQGIAQGVDQHVAVGVRDDPPGAGDQHAAEAHALARLDAVGVKSVADAQAHADTWRASQNSASARSSG